MLHFTILLWYFDLSSTFHFILYYLNNGFISCDKDSLQYKCRVLISGLCLLLKCLQLLQGLKILLQVLHGHHGSKI